MGEAKLIQVTVLVALLLLSTAVQDAAAEEGMLTYHLMGADQENGRNADLFRPGPGEIANAYNRGCEAVEGCRS
ncbi:hypothetical protein BDA96_02G087600 [Sorghum bicolor]|uniref:Uncharacterized protein n=2 Tax=Sorghum bicolor TaxID=4558 RepID=A0A921US40_SORBI|nr:hypothetical protein BDA96_02G087600 [Sorghum bicolor]KXG34739.1 hypothetical protein SORBI_3002G084200 [Sorghum bicolor]